ncbi:50S ribosomal protein L13 [Candidatus Bathyarchaeota archaeon]|nr:MAG: 50S ribosomal protein L13 [Candidatus Bathyarchaeota archaeon]
MDDEVVIDASGAILGRLASIVAKRLLSGERIVIVNAEKAVLSGKRLSLLREMKEFLQVGHPGKGPHHPRRPDRILRRTIRGMLPRRKPKGVEAYRRLKVYLGVPKEYEGAELEVISEAKVDKLRCPYVTLGELAKGIGWNPEV